MEINDDQQISPLIGRITVYSIIGCPHCLQAKNLLSKYDLPYIDISLDIYPHLREEMKSRTQRNTVPQIFFNEIHVGGNADLQILVEDPARWNELLEMVRNQEPPASAPQPPDPSTAAKKPSLLDDKGDIVCSPDEYAVVVRELKESGIIKPHGFLGKHQRSFSGKEFVEWAMKTKEFDEAKAIELGNELVNRNFGLSIHEAYDFKADDTLYRLLEDSDQLSLNGTEVSSCKPREAVEIAEELRNQILKLYAKYLSPDGKSVDYKRLGESPEFEVYCKLGQELQRASIDHLTREEKLAFFINIYNALVIHGNIVQGHPSTMWQRYKFFNSVRYTIGARSYSLQDIENGVLRGNRKGVGQFWPPFGKNDPRRMVALETAEPLIHFALVCGAKSCPPIKTYSAGNIDSELKTAAEAFLENPDALEMVPEKKVVKLSKIFQWYRIDFGTTDLEVLTWILEHMSEGQKKEDLKSLISGKFKVYYMHYDWNANAK